MRTYELTYLISSKLKTEEVQNVVSKIKSLLQSKGGVLIENKIQKPVKLGYEIKKQKEALLAVLKLQMNPENIKPFRQAIKEVPEILRFLILTAKPGGVKKETPKAVKEPLKSAKVAEEKKVELKDIEEKLEEILGE